MGIWFVSEVWDGIRWIIDFFVNKTPKPIQVIIFLLMILLFGNLFSFVFHLSGVHCDVDGDPVKTRTLDIITNTKILYLALNPSYTSPNLSVSEVHPWGNVISQSGEAIDQCIVELKYNPTKDRYEYCDRLNDTNCIVYYDRGECFNCTELDVGWAYSPDAIFKYFNKGKVCDGDAQATDLNWFQRNYLCNPLCRIPEHYAFSRDNLNFYCIDLDYCGVNATIQPNSELEEELLLADAEPIYTTDDDNFRLKNFIGITCSENYNPRIALFGKIDLFDFRYWVLLIVLYVMMIFLTKIKRH